MRAGIKNAIIAILKDYPNYEAYRRERELDLRYPAVEPDDNVGGGRTTREHDAKMINYIVSIESDKRLRALERQHARLIGPGTNSLSKSPTTLELSICNVVQMN